MSKEIKNKLKFEAFKYACESDDIDEDVEEFCILARNLEYIGCSFECITYSSRRDEIIDYGRNAVAEEERGFEIIIQGKEDELEAIREVREGKDIEEVYLDRFKYEGQ